MRGALIGVSLTLSLPAAGQTPSDSLITGRTVPVREAVEQEAENAPTIVGPFRLTPVLELRNAGYNDVGTESEKRFDLAATVSGGTRVVVLLGGKLALRGQVIPEYTWYAELAERRTFGGSYASSLLGLFNRMTFEVGGRYGSQVGLVSSESERTENRTQSSGLVRLELELLDRLSLFAGLDAVRFRYDGSPTAAGPSPTLLLDRTDLGWRTGVRYRILESFALGAQVERFRTDFVNEAQGRDSESTGYSLVARYDRPRFYVEGSGGYRQGQGRRDEGDQVFPAYRTGTYSYFASWFLKEDVLELQAWGFRRPVASYFLDNPYFLETRNAVALQLSLGERIAVNGFVSLGANAYPTDVLVGTQTIRRHDDVTEIGGGLSVRLFGNVTATVGVSRTKYASNVESVSRTVSRLSSGLTLLGGVNLLGRVPR